MKEHCVWDTYARSLNLDMPPLTLDIKVLLKSKVAIYIQPVSFYLLHSLL